MILLDVETYCQNCSNFNPSAERLYTGNGVVDTKVYCSRHAACAEIARNIRKEFATNVMKRLGGKETIED